LVSGKEIALVFSVASKAPRPRVTVGVGKTFIAARDLRGGRESFESVSSDGFVGVIVAASSATVVGSGFEATGSVHGRHGKADEIFLLHFRTSHDGENNECKSKEEENAGMHDDGEEKRWTSGSRGDGREKRLEKDSYIR
jgi:hypothetical protein